MTCRGLVVARASRVACLLWLSAGQAGALPKLQGIAESSLGYSDNVRTTPSDPALAGKPRSRGAFWMLSPAGVLALESPRYVQRLTYRYEYDLYFAESEASGSSNRLDYRAFFDLAPRLSLRLGALVNE